MSFRNFKGNPQELVGMEVVCSWGMYNKSIRKITRVTKTGFAIDGCSGLFKLNTGHEKGFNYSYPHCELILPGQADAVRKEWKREKLTKEYRASLPALVAKADLETLEKIKAILEGK